MNQDNIKEPKKLTLISFIGSGDYEEVNYLIDGKQFKARLSLKPIIETFHPDIIYVIGTKESKWTLLEGLNYQKIEIPSGRNENELWQIFSSIAEGLSIENTEIIFDITHCFRSIPFFVVLLSKFLSFIKKQTEIRSIFYGFLDKQTKESRIVDLAPLLEMLDVIDSLNSLEKYGDLKDFSRLLERKEKILRNQFPKSLREIKKVLDRLTDITEMTYIPQLSEIAENLDSLLQDEILFQEAGQHFKPLLLLKDRLQALAARFKIKPEWKSQLEVAKWYNENRHPSQALLVLRETIITYVCQEKNLDPYDNNNRDLTEKDLSEFRKKPRSDLDQLWDKIAQKRNETAHALMRRDAQMIKPEKARKKIQDLILESEDLLSRFSGKN